MHAAACHHLQERRWEDAMLAFERAFRLDPEGRIDRRTCFEWFRGLRIDEVSPFWLGELRRFFAREDIDRFEYATAGLQALSAVPAFRTLLAAAAALDEPFAPPRDALAPAMADELFRALLRDALMCQSSYERLLTRLRRALLLQADCAALAPLDFLCDFARQCFNNEFVYSVSAEEAEGVARLAGEIELELGRAAGEKLWHRLALVALYRPLHGLRGLEAWLSSAQGLPAALQGLLGHSVGEVLAERRLAASLPAAGALAPESLAVQAQYEASPYPRWRSLNRWPPITAPEWLRREIADPKLAAALPREPQVLVAGCGTGIETLSLALLVPGLRITAIDLSRASLAYAQRMARRLEAPTVRFLQADLLGLGTWTESFDIVYSSGVVHHLREPREGLGALASRVKPGGLLKIAVYSRRARAAIQEARAQVSAGNLATDDNGLRAMRERVLTSAPDAPMRRLLRFRDFFTLSECRDLIFHVQEHQYLLPEIAALLREAGLQVLGLSRRLPPGALEAYRRLYPSDHKAADLARWDAVEAQHPDLFAGMFHLWSRRPVATP